MKKLTGRAAEDFADQSKLDYQEFMILPETCQDALIIEFFDSGGIYISIEPNRGVNNIIFFDVYIDFELHSPWSTRTEATNAGITKANALYNLNN